MTPKRRVINLSWFFLSHNKLNKLIENFPLVMNIYGHMGLYCWFSRDVTKFQTSELLILLRFYFHDVLEQLKTNIQTNFHSKWVLGLVIDYS